MEEKQQIINNNKVVLDKLKEKTDKMVEIVKNIEKNNKQSSK